MRDDGREHVSLLRLVKENTSATSSPRAVLGRPCSCHSLHRGVAVPDAVPPRERTHRLAECSASGGVYAWQSPARETAHEKMVQQHREKTWHRRYLAEVRSLHATSTRVGGSVRGASASGVVLHVMLVCAHTRSTVGSQRILA
jgi:hypothetical protein